MPSSSPLSLHAAPHAACPLVYALVRRSPANGVQVCSAIESLPLARSGVVRFPFRATSLRSCSQVRSSRAFADANASSVSLNTGFLSPPLQILLSKSSRSIIEFGAGRCPASKHLPVKHARHQPFLHRAPATVVRPHHGGFARPALVNRMAPACLARVARMPNFVLIGALNAGAIRTQEIDRHGGQHDGIEKPPAPRRVCFANVSRTGGHTRNRSPAEFQQRAPGCK